VAPDAEWEKLDYERLDAYQRSIKFVQTEPEPNSWTNRRNFNGLSEDSGLVHARACTDPAGLSTN